MNSGQRRLDVVAAIGLGLGAVFGLAGTVVSDASLRQTFWGIDGVGIIVATALLTAKFLRRGDDCVAAGFLVFAIGESLLVSERVCDMDSGRRSGRRFTRHRGGQNILG